MRRSIFISIYCLFPIIAFSQVLINEVMSSNQTTVIDEDNDYPDWFELYNISDSTINLDGFGVSDDSGEPFKWIFPQVFISPKDFKLIFASGKDRRTEINHLQTIIDWGDIWNYREGTEEPPENWFLPGFDDSDWQSGATSIGYGDYDDATLINRTTSLYIRKTFNVGDSTEVRIAMLHVDYDDAFVAYLNGVEIARANIGEPNVRPPYDQPSDTSIEPKLLYSRQPELFLIENFTSLAVTGENLLAIQVHSYGLASSNLTIVPFLTLGWDSPPDGSLGISKHLSIHAPALHTNFKLSAAGELLVLTRPDGTISDFINTGPMLTDISLGRQPDGSANRIYFQQSTPGSSNSTQPIDTTVVEPPIFSHPGGFYNQTISLALTHYSPDAKIYFTLDGSEPAADATFYTSTILINPDQTTIVRARAFRGNDLPSRIITKTYFENREVDLPVISLVTSPENLWDNETGIYVEGDNAQSVFPYLGANFWQDWEKPLHIELYEPTGDLGFSIEAGIKIFGGWSRGYPQKSFAIFAREKYGYPKIEYRIFPNENLYEFKSIILRNSGNDWNLAHFRDGLMQQLVKSLNIDAQAFRPAMVYLNGAYWGIYNIREKINEDYISAHYNIDPNEIDLLENSAEVLAGSNDAYKAMLNYISQHGLIADSSYAFISNKMDINNFLDYMVSEIYFDNQDWPGNNVKFWREQKSAARWRWILFDTDFGFAKSNEDAYITNTLEFAASADGQSWANPPWSTFLLRSLFENETFKRNFINRFADCLNTVFDSAVVNQKITNIVDTIANEMEKHKQRWGGDLADWQYHIERMRNFANNRPSFVRQHIQDKFQLSGTYSLSVKNLKPEGGRVQINNITVTQDLWQGLYFSNIPLPILALPTPGYSFAGWSGDIVSDLGKITPTPQNDFSLIVDFSKDSVETKDSIETVVIFNEINYNSSVDFDPEDWVELYNDGPQTVEVSNWIFKDDNDLHSFIFPEGAAIESGDYLVLCRDTTAFKVHFPDVINYIGNFNFGLRAGEETLRLFADKDFIIDSLTYNISSPWPDLPNGNGSTLVLIDSKHDNTLPESWVASFGHGSPGQKNDIVITKNAEKPELPQRFYLAQNYPNPFNPETTISFQLPKKQFVSLKIFDVTGREMAVLLEKDIPAGDHTVTWRPSFSVASGIYFYRLRAGEYTEVRRMLLLK